ncbi:hypothetical protein Lal_00013800 [Lupinus albus]|nr:hypothetical protein Lal_00013800 [Lupinus albus]
MWWEGFGGRCRSICCGWPAQPPVSPSPRSGAGRRHCWRCWPASSWHAAWCCGASGRCGRDHRRGCHDRVAADDTGHLPAGPGPGDAAGRRHLGTDGGDGAGRGTCDPAVAGGAARPGADRAGAGGGDVAPADRRDDADRRHPLPATAGHAVPLSGGRQPVRAGAGAEGADRLPGDGGGAGADRAAGVAGAGHPPARPVELSERLRPPQPAAAAAEPAVGADARLFPVDPPVRKCDERGVRHRHRAVAGRAVRAGAADGAGAAAGPRPGVHLHHSRRGLHRRRCRNHREGVATMDVHAISILGAALAVSVGAIGPALAEGRAVAAAMEAIARQPEAANTLSRTLFVGLAMIETMAIYCLVVALLLLFANPFA